ncbi:hypothetical protein CC117_25500 [Parafrankia colletiae]|uniref:Uncharacterized protein n=1 Tax=Parafrankia colletiae TaxID=573497 RepID=A0A1S1QCH4_9ACTN|nr:hypothetical protein CC117_25500 [Parafrankia colletiae]
MCLAVEYLAAPPKKMLGRAAELRTRVLAAIDQVGRPGQLHDLQLIPASSPGSSPTLPWTWARWLPP